MHACNSWSDGGDSVPEQFLPNLVGTGRDPVHGVVAAHGQSRSCAKARGEGREVELLHVAIRDKRVEMEPVHAVVVLEVVRELVLASRCGTKVLAGASLLELKRKK
jgi:hypothetical protein